jgi:hypothetical protein
MHQQTGDPSPSDRVAFETNVASQLIAPVDCNFRLDV